MSWPICKSTSCVHGEQYPTRFINIHICLAAVNKKCQEQSGSTMPRNPVAGWYCMCHGRRATTPTRSKSAAVAYVLQRSAKTACLGLQCKSYSGTGTVGSAGKKPSTNFKNSRSDSCARAANHQNKECQNRTVLRWVQQEQQRFLLPQAVVKVPVHRIELLHAFCPRATRVSHER